MRVLLNSAEIDIDQTRTVSSLGTGDSSDLGTGDGEGGRYGFQSKVFTGGQLALHPDKV